MHTRNRISLPLLVLTWLSGCLLGSCNFSSPDGHASPAASGPFEGTLTLTESQGFTGSLFNAHTTFFISDHRIRREQRLGGLNAPFNVYAGMIADLKRDSVILYYASPFKKIKHQLTTGQLQEKLEGFDLPATTPSSLDLTFTHLLRYERSRFVPDSAILQGFQADYSLFPEGFMKQEIFDTRAIEVRRELLELVFVHLPDSIHFPLRSELKTRISEVPNDSVIDNQGTRLLEKVLKNIVRGENKTELEEYEVESLSESKGLRRGVELLKRGVDLNFTLTSQLSSIASRSIQLAEWLLPDGDFEEIEDFEAFFMAIPSGGEELDD